VSSPRRIGLPETLRMRHDVHFVDQLGRPGGEPVGRMVPIEDVEPNPHQPRQHMGDLTELIASVREKGVLEPILVRPRGARFQIIAGERRYRAAIEAGLAEIPCIVRETSDSETMEIALIENLQRKDLSAFEEADGLKTLAESYGYTHEAMAERLGKSRTSITETPWAACDFRTFSAVQVSMPTGWSRPSSVYSWLTASSPWVEPVWPAGSGKNRMPSWCMPAWRSWSSTVLLASGLKAGPSDIGSPQAYRTSAT